MSLSNYAPTSWEVFSVTQPRLGAVCGKASRKVLCGGRAMKRASLPLYQQVTILLRRMSPLMALFGHADCIERCPVLGVKRKTSARREYFAF
jgi:hypothetical protein